MVERDPRLIIEEQKPCLGCGGPIFRSRNGRRMGRQAWDALLYCNQQCAGAAARGRSGPAVWRNCRFCHKRVLAAVCHPHKAGGWIGPCCAGKVAAS